MSQTNSFSLGDENISFTPRPRCQGYCVSQKGSDTYHSTCGKGSRCNNFAKANTPKSLGHQTKEKVGVVVVELGWED